MPRRSSRRRVPQERTVDLPRGSTPLTVGSSRAAKCPAIEGRQANCLPGDLELTDPTNEPNSPAPARRRRAAQGISLSQCSTRVVPGAGSDPLRPGEYGGIEYGGLPVIASDESTVRSRAVRSQSTWRFSQTIWRTSDLPWILCGSGGFQIIGGVPGVHPWPWATTRLLEGAAREAVRRDWHARHAI